MNAKNTMPNYLELENGIPMSTKKFLTVPKNSQIPIGKKWAGRQVLIEEVSDSELRIRDVTNVPDSHKAFFTTAAQESLDEFNTWEATAPAEFSKASDVIAQLRKQRNDPCK